MKIRYWHILAFGQQFNILIQITWLTFASFPLLCYPFDLRPRISKVSVDRILLCETEDKNKAEEIPLKQIYSNIHLLIWLCFPWRFSRSVFWMTLVLSTGIAELGYRGTFHVMSRSSSWHNFISRHMSFQEYYGCQQLNARCTGNVVMYQIY